MKNDKEHLEELVSNWLGSKSKKTLSKTNVRLRQRHSVSAGPGKSVPRKLLMNLQRLWSKQEKRK